MNFIPNLRALLTQQSPSEEKYRDMPIGLDDKMIIIEFKAPEFDSNRKCFKYEFNGKQIKKLKELNDKTHGNVFIGLIHAKLLPEIRTSGVSSPSPFYKIYAVPSTTLFIRVSDIKIIDAICHIIDEIKKDKSKISVKLYLNDIIFGNDYVESIFPECLSFEYTYLPKDNICKTCGGISSCYCYSICRRAVVCHCIGCRELELSVSVDTYKEGIPVPPIDCCYSLVEILMLLRSCKIGYKVRDIREFNDIIRIIDENMLSTLMLSYSLEVGVIPLLVKAGEAVKQSQS
jgi:hypothetical protein